jgi:hypothetical protein
MRWFTSTRWQRHGCQKESTRMRYRRLGRSGLQVSTLTLGTAMAAGAMAYGPGALRPAGPRDDEAFGRCVRAAIDAGIIASGDACGVDDVVLKQLDEIFARDAND